VRRGQCSPSLPSTPRRWGTEVALTGHPGQHFHIFFRVMNLMCETRRSLVGTGKWSDNHLLVFRILIDLITVPDPVFDVNTALDPDSGSEFGYRCFNDENERMKKIHT